MPVPRFLACLLFAPAHTQQPEEIDLFTFEKARPLYATDIPLEGEHPSRVCCPCHHHWRTLGNRNALWRCLRTRREHISHPYVSRLLNRKPGLYRYLRFREDIRTLHRP